MTSDAIHDLREIKRETYRIARSRKVADDYLKRVRRHLRHLAYTAEACPRFQRVDGALTDYRFSVAEHHVAYFKVEAGQSRIVRVLPSRMNFERRLRPSDGD